MPNEEETRRLRAMIAAQAEGSKDAPVAMEDLIKAATAMGADEDQIRGDVDALRQELADRERSVRTEVERVRINLIPDLAVDVLIAAQAVLESTYPIYVDPRQEAERLRETQTVCIPGNLLADLQVALADWADYCLERKVDAFRRGQL